MNRPINVNLRNSQPMHDRVREEMRRFEEKPQMPSQKEKDNSFIIRVMDKIIGLSIFMLFFGVPLYFTGLTSQGIVFEKQMYFYFWLLLGLVMWAAKSVIAGEMNIKRTPLDFPIIGFWLAYLAATIFSIDRWHSFWGSFGDPSRGFASITAYVIAYYFIFSNFRTNRIKTILTAIISSGTILILWTTLAVLGVNFLPESMTRFAPISLAGSITGIGIIFSALVPLITVAILKVAESQMAKTKKNVLLGAMLVALALDMFLILALYNYVPWLAFFVGVVVLLIFILAKIMRPSASWTWLPMAIFVLVMILRMTGAVDIAKINLPVEVSLNYKTSADIAKEAIKDRFLVGSGPATYGYDFSLYKPKEFNLNALYNLRFFQSTGILFGSLPTIGAVGTFFLLILILSYLGSQVYLLYKDKERNKLYSLGIFSAAIILFINALIVRVDGAILALAVLFITLGLAVSVSESDVQDRNLSLSLKASPKFALALAFVFMVVSAGVAFLFVYLGKIYAADFYAASSSRNIATDSDSSLQDLGKAARYNSRESKYYVQFGQYYMALANQEAMKGENDRDINKIRLYLNNSIAAAVQAKNISGKDVSAVENLALVYENAGLYISDSLSLAEENYKKAQELEPHNPIYLVKLGQIKIAMAAAKKTADEKKQLVSEAKDLFQKATEEKENYADGYYQLALTHEALGELDQAIENGTKALQLNQKNANYILALGRFYQSRNRGEDMKAAEQLYKAVVALNDKDINGHFYLGLLYEKNSNKSGAKDEYKKVIDILSSGNGKDKNSETIDQLNKMIQNVDRGIANTPENLGLIQKTQAENNATNESPEVPNTNELPIEPASTASPTIEEAQPAEEVQP